VHFEAVKGVKYAKPIKSKRLYSTEPNCFGE
jgi:hypothetical protein